MKAKPGSGCAFETKVIGQYSPQHLVAAGTGFGITSFTPRFVAATQDGRRLRRYRRRWKIERLFAWLHNFRRIVIRWEYYPENFLGMVQLACAVILLRHLWDGF
jgi:transposase